MITHEPSPAPGQRAAIAKGVLLAAALAVVAAPLSIDPETDWLRTPIPACGALLALLTLASYGFLSSHGALLRRRTGGFRLDLIDAILLLALPLYALATSNSRLLTSGDNLATRNLGPLIVMRRTFDLSDVSEYQENPNHYSALRVGDRLLPAFPIGTGLLSVPYAAVSLELSGGRKTPQLLDRSEKQLAALLFAASAVSLFLGVRRRFGEKAALGTAVVFGLATPALTTGSQGLWSTTGETFCLSAALWCVLPGKESDVRATAGGFAAAAAFLCRPTAVIPAAFIGLALLLTRRRAALFYGAAATAGCAAAAIFLFHLYGHPLGGYVALNPVASAWSARPIEGFLGNLVSPSRGLLVFFPYLLALPLARPALWRNRELTCWFGVSLGTVVSLYALTSVYWKWWGGHGIGPRLMAEASPFLALLTIPLWTELAGRRWALTFVFATVGFAAATQVLGLYRAEAGNWNGDAHVDQNRKALWTFRQSQILAMWWPRALAIPLEEASIIRGRRRDDLLTGGLDTLPNGGVIHGPLVVRGWARIPGEDLETCVLLDGKERVRGPAARYPRPDVCAVIPRMVDCTKAGFEARFEFEDGDEGRHEITA
ncbi:MAG: hypothetical protein ACM3JH_13515, partial [Acidithiobacillales bacterium]